MLYGRELQPRKEQSEGARRQALVIGGSIGGMVAARALADHFDEVVLVERDYLPSGQENRPGVPQARHLHFILKRGLKIIEELFPGVKPDLLEAGCHLVDQGKDVRILYPYGWSPRVALEDVQILTFTRPLFESTVRRHLLDNPKVSILEGHEVCGLVSDDDHQRVTGVRVRARNRNDQPEEGAETVLHADLVVDTSGRPSEAPQWLTDLGFPAPEETVIDAFWGYATRIYEPPANWQADWKVTLCLNRPPYQPRAGVIQPIEGGRWLVSVAGVMRDYPPTDEEGFLQFAKSLSTSAIYDAIKDARPLSGIRGFRRTANRLRHFDKLASMPEGFVAMGDAVCGFNPIYGQGMTLACLSALEMGKWLRESGGGRLDPLVYHKKIAKLVEAPWAMATGADLLWPATQGGEINAPVRFMHWYVDQIMRLIPDHPEVYRRFQRVNHMLDGPESLFHPAISGQVLLRALTPDWRRFLPARQKKAAPAAETRHTTVTLQTRVR
ncbi:MAG TPA: 2-polyprenyl-6-methoxyphenol hydroxylase-like oxidoreductase [Thermoanaerobaculia bacterium]|nr:2-polyprenyl-6-methoxyphenol hydroxylase-like oxidoreductase [Thermoanaerobaculia bacterium]